MARSAGIRRKLDHGWAMTSAGLLAIGAGKSKVEARPTALLPSKYGEPDFDPRQDAYATKLRAECEGPNRYRLGTLLLDAHGACRDETECPECGSSPIVREHNGKVIQGGEYRWSVPVPGQPGQRMECSRCVKDEELNEARQRANSLPPKRGGR